MRIFTKQNLPLVFALAIPILMILGIAGVVYIPNLTSKPQYNFLYMTGDGAGYSYYNSEYEYLVQDGHLKKYYRKSFPENSGLYANKSEVQIYLYNMQTKQSKELNFEEASRFNLDTANLSPDGYQVVRGGGGADILFFGGRSDYNSWFLQGHNHSKKLDLKLSGNYYSSNFKFLGWVK